MLSLHHTARAPPQALHHRLNSHLLLLTKDAGLPLPRVVEAAAALGAQRLVAAEAGWQGPGMRLSLNVPEVRGCRAQGAVSSCRLKHKVLAWPLLLCRMGSRMRAKAKAGRTAAAVTRAHVRACALCPTVSSYRMPRRLTRFLPARWLHRRTTSLRCCGRTPPWPQCSRAWREAAGPLRRAPPGGRKRRAVVVA